MGVALMHPRPFGYLAPTSIDEACAMLAENEWAKVMSGGMSLIPMMKLRLLSPPTVIDIGRIPGLDYVADRGDHIAIGALTTHATVAQDPLIGSHATALRQAAQWTGDVQVRNRGTLCGTVAHADLAADTPVAALALGTTMVATSVRGQRLIAADDFFVDTLQSALEPDEILTEVRVPIRPGGSAYDKLGRRGGHTDYAVAGVAVWVGDASGTGARVAVTGVGTKPLLATAAMDALASGMSIDDAAGRVTDGITVLEDLYGSEEYKAHLASVFARRAYAAALADAA